MMQEKIIWSEKPSKKFIFYYSFLHFDLSSASLRRPLVLTFLIAFWIFGFFYLLIDIEARRSAGWGGLIALGIILALLIIPIVIYNICLWKSYKYAITTNGVKIQGGSVLTKITRDVPFSEITNVDISQNILEKIIGIHDLHIQTAGSRSLGQKSEISFLALENPQVPKNLILHYIRKIEGNVPDNQQGKSKE